LVRNAARLFGDVGGRVRPRFAKLTRSMSRLGSRGAASLRDGLGRLVSRRRPWTLALSDERPVARTAVTVRRFGRQAMKSGNRFAASIRTAASMAADYCRVQWRVRARAIIAAAACAVALSLTIWLLVTSRAPKTDHQEPSARAARTEKRPDRAGGSKPRPSGTATSKEGSP
jgi:hypothetical protein